MKKWSWVIAMGLIPMTIWGVYHPNPADLQDVLSARESYYENRDRAENRFDLAMALAYTGQIESAWKIIKPIPQLDPEYPLKVVKKYEMLIRKDSDNWKYHFKLAFGYYFIGKKDEAYDSFEKALEINPNQIWAYGFQGLLLGEKKKYNEAIKRCEKALEIEPDATAIHFLMGEAMMRKGDYWGTLMKVLKVGQLKTEESNQGIYDEYRVD